MAFLEIFIGPVPTASKDDYSAYARQMGAITRKVGALSVTACWGTDGGKSMVPPLAGDMKVGDDETIVTRIVRWTSKAARDEAWGEMMKNPDPQMATIQMPFDRTRVRYAAFEEIDA